MSRTPTTLIAHLKEKIALNHGAISFSAFMQAALYHPDFGYYNRSDFKLGEKGDFTTAPEISFLFGQCVANQCREIILALPGVAIMEVGAGSGALALHILQALEKANCLPLKYYIHDISPHLRSAQQRKLKTALPDYYQHIVWLTDWPTDFVGVVLANEVLDALPVDCFKIENGEVKERVVVYENDSFIMKTMSPITPHLKESVLALGEFPEGYASEINLTINDFLKKLIGAVKKGVILFSDYGYGREEYYRPERNKGTLTCFYQHQKNDNPLINIGSQDITAHVDFTSVIEVACDAGCTLEGFTSQASFLLATGLLTLAEEVEKKLSQKEMLTQNQAIKTLTLPSEMGEVIKFMALGKGFSMPLAGFQLSDRSRELG